MQFSAFWPQQPVKAQEEVETDDESQFTYHHSRTSEAPSPPRPGPSIVSSHHPPCVQLSCWCASNVQCLCSRFSHCPEGSCFFLDEFGFPLLRSFLFPPGRSLVLGFYSFLCFPSVMIYLHVCLPHQTWKAETRSHLSLFTHLSKV